MASRRRREMGWRQQDVGVATALDERLTGNRRLRLVLAGTARPFRPHQLQRMVDNVAAQHRGGVAGGSAAGRFRVGAAGAQRAGANRVTVLHFGCDLSIDITALVVLILATRHAGRRIGAARRRRVGRKRDRALVRWSVEQEIEALKAAGRTDAIPLVMPELCRDPEPNEDTEIRAWVRHDVYLGLASGAKGVLINVTGGDDMTLLDVNTATSLIYDEAGEDANIIFGLVKDPSMGSDVKVTLIATGFVAKTSETAPREEHLRTFLRGQEEDNQLDVPTILRRPRPTHMHNREISAGSSLINNS